MRFFTAFLKVTFWIRGLAVDASLTEQNHEITSWLVTRVSAGCFCIAEIWRQTQTLDFLSFWRQTQQAGSGYQERHA